MLMPGAKMTLIRLLKALLVVHALLVQCPVWI